jgi:hypothetical protein
MVTDFADVGRIFREIAWVLVCPRTSFDAVTADSQLAVSISYTASFFQWSHKATPPAAITCVLARTGFSRSLHPSVE